MSSYLYISGVVAIMIFVIVPVLYLIIHKITHSFDNDGWDDATSKSQTSITSDLPTIGDALPPIEDPEISTEGKKIIMVRDMTPIEQMTLAGYRCAEVEDTDRFNHAVAVCGNFESDAEGRLCINCGTSEYPFLAWGGSRTKEDGLVGCFCSVCGCGFLAVYSLKTGNCEAVPETVFRFLRPESVSAYNRVLSRVDNVEDDSAKDIKPPVLTLV